MVRRVYAGIYMSVMFGIWSRLPQILKSLSLADQASQANRCNIGYLVLMEKIMVAGEYGTGISELRPP